VLADIGDRQSLAAHLSTFTAHVRNISRMIELCAKSRGPALVLLDEVGTGTDPEEGSALGVAVVDHFRRACGAHVVATTHYSGLKHYAASDDGVTNASVEFDEETLQPTYRLLVGVAGSSSGLEIAERFGFPREIVREAASRVDQSAREAGEYLRRIKREAEEAEAMRRALEEERAAVAEKYNSLEREAARREVERQQKFERDLRAGIAEFEQRSRELISKIEDRAERVRVEREAERRAAELRREAKQAAQAARAATKAATVEQPGGVRVVRHGAASASSPSSFASEPSHTSSSAQSSAAEFRPAAEQREIVKGDAVKLRAFGKTGVVESVRDGEAEVRVGNLRLREKLSNLELMERAPAAKADATQRARGARLEQFAAARPTTEVRLKERGHEPDAELNLIGKTTDEAREAADKFLDEASLHQLSHVRIIHGHGTGALRRAIAELLRGHPHVAKFELAPPDQGGAGATVVELR
jgi:DNA mismatch repair protein MutS2